jgi:hypothetical protein
MADQRIKGQEVELLLVVNGVPQTTTTDVRSMEVAPKLEMLEEGYLGETSDRYDEIYKGIRGNIELHFENQDVFTFFQSVVNRARRRTPGTTINIKAALNFPNGQRPRIIIKDAYFGEFPIGFGSRQDYGTVRLDFQATDYSVL